MLAVALMQINLMCCVLGTLPFRLEHAALTTFALTFDEVLGSASEIYLSEYVPHNVMQTSAVDTHIPIAQSSRANALCSICCKKHARLGS